LPGRHLEDYAGELKEAAGNLPVPLSSISLGFKGSLLSSSSQRRQECRSSLISLFDLCGDLAIPLFNMPPALTQDNGNRLVDAAERDALLIEQLPGLAGEAGGRGVALLLEPVNRYESEYLNTLSHAVAICEQVAHPNVGVTADLFHMQIEELSTAASIQGTRKWLKHFHVAANNRQEPGIGSMDFASAFAALKEIGYDGGLEVESRSLSGPPEECLPRSVEFLRKAWREAG
jgi:sugar phosphate isomerase/epimerase